MHCKTFMHDIIPYLLIIVDAKFIDCCRVFVYFVSCLEIYISPTRSVENLYYKLLLLTTLWVTRFCVTRIFLHFGFIKHIMFIILPSTNDFVYLLCSLVYGHPDSVILCSTLGNYHIMLWECWLPPEKLKSQKSSQRFYDN